MLSETIKGLKFILNPFSELGGKDTLAGNIETFSFVTTNWAASISIWVSVGLSMGIKAVAVSLTGVTSSICCSTPESDATILIW